jgi:hypothetical protein
MIKKTALLPNYFIPQNDKVMILAYNNFQDLVYKKLNLLEKINKELESPQKWKWQHLLNIIQTASDSNSLIILDNNIPEHHEIAGMLLAIGMPGVVQFNYMQSVVSLANLDVLNATNGTKGRELGKRAGTHTVHNFDKDTHSKIFDFNNLAVSSETIHEFMTYMFSKFPLAFRAPGVSNLPDHMRSNDNHTTQIVCPPIGDPFYETTKQAMASGKELWNQEIGLFCTSANASSDTNNYKKVPPHTHPKALFQELYNRENINEDYIVPFFSISDNWKATVEKMTKFKNSEEGVIISSTTNLFLDPELQNGTKKVVFTCGRHGSIPQEVLKKAINEGPFKNEFEFVEADLERLPERQNYNNDWLKSIEN